MRIEQKPERKPALPRQSGRLGGGGGDNGTTDRLKNQLLQLRDELLAL